MKKHWAVVLPLLVMGCKGPEDKDQDGIVDGVREPDSVSVVAPANPKGTVSGQVLTTRMEALSGASVAMTIGSATAQQPFTTTTDDTGNFKFTNVPAGSQVLVTFRKEGYATLRASATVPSAAGNVPINNGNANLGAITLAETRSTVRFTLLAPSGRPASGAQAYLEAAPAGTIAFNGGTATAVSSVVAMAQADAQGVVTFERVPAPAELARIGGFGDEAGGYRLWIDPVDVNADGVFEAGGYVKKLDAAALMVYGSSQLIQLPAPRNDADTIDPNNPGQSTGFGILATNVPSLNHSLLTDPTQKALARRPVRNMLRPGEPISLAFSQPILKGSLLAILTDELGREKLDLVVTSSATGDVYVLTPPAAALKEGQEYNLILRASSAYDGTVKTWKGFFISGDPTSPKQPQLASVAFKDSTGTGTVGALDPGECVVVTFNHVVLASSSKKVKATVTPGGTPTGAAIVAAAPPSGDGCFNETAANSLKFPIDFTNFNEATSRFVFLYNGSAAVGMSATTKVQLSFTEFQTEELNLYYETAWSAPIPSATLLEAPLTRL